jgi:predicted DNA-binding protein with PD1-like motif
LFSYFVVIFKHDDFWQPVGIGKQERRSAMHLNVTEARKIMGRLKKGDDLLGALTGICQEMGITLGEVKVIGAVSQARVGYYHQKSRNYEWLELSKPMEILGLEGNISLKDGEPFVHAHVILADGEGRAWGGHLAEGTIVFAAEFVMQELQAEQSLNRQMDEETGLFLWAKK